MFRNTHQPPHQPPDRAGNNSKSNKRSIKTHIHTVYHYCEKETDFCTVPSLGIQKKRATFVARFKIQYNQSYWLARYFWHHLKRLGALFCIPPPKDSSPTIPVSSFQYIAQNSAAFSSKSDW